MRVTKHVPMVVVALVAVALLTLLAPLPRTAPTDAAGAPHRAASHATCAQTGKKKARRRSCRKPERGQRSLVKIKPQPAVASATVAVAAETQVSSSPAPAVAPTGSGEATPPNAAPVANPLTEPGTKEAEGVAGESPFRFFSPTSFWNQELPEDAPLDPESGPIMTIFEEEVADEIAAKTGPWIDTTAYSVPIYRVPADEPTVQVTLSAPSPSLGAAFAAVPLPADAEPAAGSDGHLVVWQPATDRLWEFWRLVKGPSGWSASWGGAMRDVQESSGAYGPSSYPGATRWWGASASSLSIAGGLITLEDLELGVINHALAISVPNVRAGVFASPAQRTDGSSPNPLSLPEGAHLRLNPGLDLASLHLPPLTLEIARAAQRYGIVVRDGSPNVASFYAQDPTPTGTDPYHEAGGYFEGKYPSQLLASFPWRHLELLSMELEDEE